MSYRRAISYTLSRIDSEYTSATGRDSKKDPRGESMPTAESRLWALSRPLVQIYERSLSRPVQVKPPLPPLDCPTGRAYLEAGLVVSKLLGADRDRGRLRAETVYSQLSRPACRELRSSHNPGLVAAAEVPEILRVAPDPDSTSASAILRASRGPVLSRAHATCQRLQAGAAEVAEATDSLCRSDDPEPLKKLLSPLLRSKNFSPPSPPVKTPLPADPNSSPPTPSAYAFEGLRDLSPSLRPPSANTPHKEEELREVQERKSLLITPIEQELGMDTDETCDVKVIRSWKQKSLPSGRRYGGGRGVSIPPNVSEGLYRKIETHLPGVARDPELRRALVYLKMIARPDPRSGYLPFHEMAVAHIRGAPSLADRHEAQVYDLAERLQEALAEDLSTGEEGPSPFRIIGHAKGQNCVQVTSFQLPEPLEEAFSEEAGRALLAITTGELRDTVNLESGNKGRPERRQKRRKRRRRKAEGTGKRLDVPGRAQRLQQELHDLPQDRFRDNLESAKTELLSLTEERVGGQSGKRSGSGELPYLGQLRTIADVSVPLYKFTGSTLRLTPAGPSLAALPKKMRQAVFGDYLEVDMASAQLALAGSLWGLPDLRAFLKGCRESGKSWWTELAGHLAEELPAPHYDPDKRFKAVKGTLKGFTYGLFFGMQRKNLRRLGNPKASSTDEERYYKSIRKMNLLFLGETRSPCPEKRAIRKRGAKVGDALFEHPLIKGLLRRRDQLLSKIRREGGITDCFGRRIEANEDRDPKSVLAEYMQNAELRVMLPVGEKVLNDLELRFGLWQHDGVTIAPRRRKPWAYRKALKKARKALRKGREGLAKEMDAPPIETELTVDYGEEFLRS